MKRRLLLLVLLFTLISVPARAHDITPGVLTLIEMDEANRFTVVWRPPSEATSTGQEIRIDYPSGCSSASTAGGSGTTVFCHAGFQKRIHFEGIRSARIKIITTIRYRDGRVVEGVATQSKPDVDLGESTSPSALAWIRLGIEHVLTGFDHIAFVIGLFLLIGVKANTNDRRGRLIATITAFTIAHSITLALASLRIVSIPARPVEATIALSILLVARESLSQTKTKSLAKERPWLVAFLFGLIHGLGFAGALGELPLQRSTVLAALLSFNVGIEIAQLGIIAVLFLIARFFETKPNRPLAYAIGALGAFWFFDRAAYLVLNR